MDHRVILPDELPHFVDYYRYERCFSPPECAELIRIAESKEMSQGSVGIAMGQTPIVDHSIRQALTVHIGPDEAPWAFDNLRQKIQWANAEYRFDLSGLYEDIGIMRYDAPLTSDTIAGHYNWHQDFGGGHASRRKISLVSLLSDPRDFDGGELRLFTSTELKADLSQRGDMVMFPSWTSHCVTSLTRGRRYSLVAWISGPRFR